MTHLARCLGLWDKELAKLKKGQHALDAIIGIDNWQRADIEAVDDFQCLGTGAFHGDAVHISFHDMFQPRRDIANKGWQRHLEAIEDGIDPGIGVAAAGRSVMRFAMGMLQCLVGNGRTNGIGIGILVAKDIDGLFAHERMMDER